jgi:hypothetical protein
MEGKQKYKHVRVLYIISALAAVFGLKIKKSWTAMYNTRYIFWIPAVASGLRSHRYTFLSSCLIYIVIVNATGNLSSRRLYIII